LGISGAFGFSSVGFPGIGASAVFEIFSSGTSLPPSLSFLEDFC
jgi:hypothetical protein